jgi:hypothetical protein
MFGVLKGTVSRDFRPLVFSSNNPTWAPYFAYCYEFAKIFDYEIADFGTSGVNDTAGAKNDP